MGGVTVWRSAVALLLGVTSVNANQARAAERLVPSGLQLPPGNPNSPSPTYGWVREYLANASADLGYIHIDILDVNFLDFRCHGMTLGPISSEYTAPTNIAVHIGETTLRCNSTWEHKLPFERKARTGLYTLKINVTDINALVTLGKDRANLIVNSTLSNCLAKMNLDMAMGKNATGFEDWVIKQLNGNISSLVNSSVCDLLANVAEKDLGGGLKNLSMALEPYMAPITPQPPEHVPDLSDVLDLEQTPVITYLNYMASIALGPEKLDELIDFMLPKGWVGASGVNGLNVSVPLASFSNTTLPYGLGNLTVVAGVSGFNITGLSSFNGLTLFEAVGPQTLRSAIGLESVTVRLTGFLELLSAERANREPLVEWLDIFIRVDNVTLTQLTQVVALKDVMQSMRGGKELNFSCFSTAFAEWNTTFIDYESSMSKTTYVRLGGGNVDRDVDQFIDQIFDITMASLEPVLPSVLRGILDGPIREDLNQARAMKQRNATCQDTPLPDNLPPNAVWSTVAGCVVTAIMCIIVMKFKSDNRVHVAKHGQHQPAFISKNVPFGLRVVIVALLVSTLGLFVLGILAHGGAVTLEVTIGDKPAITLPPLYYLSLMGSIQDTFKAKVYALSIFIGASNLIGPALRVATLAFVCAAPAWALTHRTRVQVTLACDLLGKWVFAQAYVALLMMIAFKYNLTLTQTPVPSTANIFLVFDWWGWWGITTCTTLGLVASHFVLYALNRVSAAESFDDGGHRVEAHDLHTASRAKIITISVLLFASVILILYGSTIPAYIFEYKAMTKALAVATDSPYRAEYSFWTTVTLMPDEHVGHANGVALMQTVLVLTAFIAPVLQGLGALVLYNLPMTAKPRRWATAALQFVSAWAALDVFIVSVVLGFFQIGLFAQFVVGDKCDALSPILHAEQIEKLLDGDPKCLDVSATLCSGLLALGLPAVVIQVLSVYIMVKSRRTSRFEAASCIESPFSLHTPPDASAKDRIALLTGTRVEGQTFGSVQ